MKHTLYIIGGLLSMALFAASCDSDEQPGMEDKAIVEVPLEFNLTSGGSELTTRAEQEKPDKPNIRPIHVDKVDVYVYHRSVDAIYQTETEGFVWADKLTFPAIETGTTGEGQPRYTATGKVPLDSDYEYMMTAVAYSAEQGENELFELNKSFFDHAEISLKEDKNDYKTPELFFGNVVYNWTDTVFRYDSKNENQKKLTGWLYRGVAGVELNLLNVEENVKQIDLLADSINTRVKARVYDDFRSAYGMKKDGTFEHYVIGSWTRDNDNEKEKGKIQIVGSNLLPVCTSLSLRITLDDDKRVVCRLQVRDKKKDENEGTDENGGTEGGAGVLRSIPGDGGNGTGIIPGGEETPVEPEEPDPDKNNPYKICFKRNNYYILNGDYEALTTMNYVLQVTVNPNWDGDIYLPLDKSDDSN